MPRIARPAPIGEKINRLTIISEVERGSRGQRMVNCLCECGAYTVTNLSSVLSESTKSCGRLQIENRHKNHSRLSHGECHKTLEHRSWAAMKARCLNKNNHAYHRYGGRGITVCSRWLGKCGYENFLADMGRAPTSDHGIAIIDRDKDYSPENCQWMGRKQRQERKIIRAIKIARIGDLEIPQRILEKVWVGARYESLIVVDQPFRKDGYLFVRCVCDCGNGTQIRTFELGKTKTCGCANRRPRDEVTKEKLRRAATVHGMRYSPEWKTWSSMRDRCKKETMSSWEDYGGRGITVCEEWENSFEAFYRDMGPRPDGKTLGRIDYNGNYCPENCEWRTVKEQNRNRRNVRMFEFHGENLSSPEVAERLGMSPSKFWRLANKCNLSPYEIEAGERKRKPK